MNDRPILATLDARQLESLRVFHEVARSLTRSLEITTLLRAIMAQMEEFFGPEKWSLFLLDEAAQQLTYALSAGLDEEPLRSIRFSISEGLTGYVARTGEPLVIPDVSRDAVWARYAAKHPELNLHSIAALPIRYADRTLAVLSLHNSKLDQLPDNAMSFLRVLCDYTAIALENARQVKLIHDLSISDDCTGLFNARYLYTLLEQQIAASLTPLHPGVRTIHPRPFSLIFFDLDHFKSVNDSHGHLVGTRLLQEIGSLIKRTLGPENSGFRYGGDEFVALLPGLDKVSATRVAQRLRRELNATVFLTAAELSLSITASFGVATFPADGENLHSIIRSADTMMYLAKANGRDRIEIADSTQPPVHPVPRISRHAE